MAVPRMERDLKELGLDVDAGTAAASKVVKLGTSKEIATLGAVTMGALAATTGSFTGAVSGTTITGTGLVTGSNLADLPTTAGVGITGTADNFASGVVKVGTLFKTTIVIDIDGLNCGGTAADIIGADGAGVAHLGQITAAVNGTIFAGKLTCLELPTGGDPDINLYSAAEATGVEDTAVTDLTETLLLNSGDLVSGTTLALTAFPAADEYLYLACGTATAGTYTAGLIEIVLYGK